MASISGLCYSSSTLEKFTPSQLRIHCLQENRSHSPTDRASIVFSAQSVARDFPSSLSKLNSESPEAKKGLEKDPAELWRRYVDWLYHNKELGLYLDVSRVGFTDEFVAEMEPKFQAAFRAMEELEKGAIANPDEGRMVGHYWLKTPSSRRIRT